MSQSSVFWVSATAVGEREHVMVEIKFRGLGREGMAVV
jgi:hypothetical protein